MSARGYKPWFGEDGIGLREMAENREHRKALRLLARIWDEIGCEQQFMIDELLDAVNERVAGGQGKSVRYGPTHILRLVRARYLVRSGSGSPMKFELNPEKTPPSET